MSIEEQTIQHPEVTLRDYLGVLFRQKWVMIITMVTVAGLVFVGLQMKTPVYEARAKMLIRAAKQVEATYYREMYGSRNVQQTLTQSEIVKSVAVIGRVVLALQLDQRSLDAEKSFASPLKESLIDMRVNRLTDTLTAIPPEERKTLMFRRAVKTMKEAVKVEPIRDTNMFTIAVRDYDPQMAMVMANVISRSYVMFDLEQQLAELTLKYGEKHPRVNQIKDNIRDMRLMLDGSPLTDVEAIGPASVKIIEQATVPLEPLGTSRTIAFGLACVMSVFLGVILAFLYDSLDQTIKTTKDLGRLINIPLLGTVPRKGLMVKALLHQNNRPNMNNPYFSAYSNLADQVRFLIGRQEARSILVTAPDSGEGVTTAVANLGVYLAREAEMRVLIVEANYRRSSMHKIFEGCEEAGGLSAVLVQHLPLEESVVKVMPNLTLLPAGKHSSKAVKALNSGAMVRFLNEAKDEYDLILFDSPGLNRHKDAQMLAAVTDGVVLIVAENKTRRHVIQQAIESLKIAEANILGSVFNNRTYPIPRIVYDRV